MKYQSVTEKIFLIPISFPNLENTISMQSFEYSRLYKIRLQNFCKYTYSKFMSIKTI